jgi:hypothetical protein
MPSFQGIPVVPYFSIGLGAAIPLMCLAFEGSLVTVHLGMHVSSHADKFSIVGSITYSTVSVFGLLLGIDAAVQC